MKKISVFIICLCCIFLPLGACKSAFTLTPFVTELRCNLYEGRSETHALRCAFGYTSRKQAKSNEDDKVYGLTFKLLDQETSNAEYSVGINYDGQEKKAVFSLNPVTHSQIAFIELDQNFALNEFSVTLFSAGERQEILLQTIVPTDTITYERALSSLYENQTSLIDEYKNQDGEFSASIAQRIIVKDGKAYWYVGISEQVDKTKALLIDGVTGEVLAIREVL